MKTLRIIAIAVLAFTSIAVLTAGAFAFMGRPGYYTSYTTNAATTYGANPSTTGSYVSYSGGMMGGGMMGGYAYPSYTQAPTSTQPTQTSTPATTTPTTQTYPYQYYGGMGCGMMGRSGYFAPPASYSTSPNSVVPAAPITLTTAVTIAQNYLTSLNNPNLAIAQVEEYSQNFYVQTYEKNTGVGAFQMLIDKYTGAISPEPGPNMMWNTKYGMMSGGMMGTYVGTPTAAMPINVNQAKTNAQQFLNTYYPGTTVGDTTTFYGYYNIEVLNAGNTYGMLSVNGYSGQVWYHTWHGTFIQEWTT